MTDADRAVVRRVLPATPDAVFDEWLDPDALREWMCPAPACATRVELDARVGGLVRIDIEELGTEFFVVGEFTELDRPRRLAFTWYCSTWPIDSDESVVTVILEPDGERNTMMTIEHERLPFGTVERHAQGWEAIGNQLAEALLTGGR